MYMERNEAFTPHLEREQQRAEADEQTRRELGSRAVADLCPNCGHELDLPPPIDRLRGGYAMAGTNSAVGVGRYRARGARAIPVDDVRRGWLELIDQKRSEEEVVSRVAEMAKELVSGRDLKQMSRSKFVGIVAEKSNVRREIADQAVQELERKRSVLFPDVVDALAAIS